MIHQDSEHFCAEKSGVGAALAPSLTSVLPARSYDLLAMAARALGCRHAGIGVVSAENNLLEFLPFGLSSEEAASLQRTGWPTQVIGQILRQPLPLSVESYSPAALLPSPLCRTEANGNNGQNEVYSLLGMPLHFPGKRGAIYFLRPGKPFSAEDEAAVAPLVGWL